MYWGPDDPSWEARQRVCSTHRILVDMLLILLPAGRSWGRGVKRKKGGIRDH